VGDHKGKLCKVVLRSKYYENPKKEYKSMQKSVKKINHEKMCDTRTDLGCKVKNV